MNFDPAFSKSVLKVYNRTQLLDEQIDTFHDTITLHRQRVAEAAGIVKSIWQDQIDKHDMDIYYPKTFFPLALNYFNLQVDRGELLRELHNHHLANSYNWQYWVTSIDEELDANPENEICNGCLKMPYHCILELIADIMAKSKMRYNTFDCSTWLGLNFNKMKMHPKSESQFKSVLLSIDPNYKQIFQTLNKPTFSMARS